VRRWEKSRLERAEDGSEDGPDNVGQETARKGKPVSAGESRGSDPSELRPRMGRVLVKKGGQEERRKGKGKEKRTRCWQKKGETKGKSLRLAESKGKSSGRKGGSLKST